jgi:hypothetical protein
MPRKISRPIQDSKQSAPVKPDLKLDLEALLSPEERENIRKKALVKIQARDLEEATERYLKQEMERLDRELHPEAEVQVVPYVPDLALYADAIRMDGRTYHHGYRYDVPAESLAQLLDIEWQTKRHEQEITRGGTQDNFYRRSREMSVNMDNGLATAGGRPVRY